MLNELSQEYRKAADLAARRGDFRRAAYIHGILLRDDRMAARCLQRGGLHRDAATIFLNNDDPAAAAQAFEAAGDVDRAIALYRQIGQHESAGDLFRRIGEEAGAIQEYVLAAQQKTDAKPADFLSAGSLLLKKARRLDLAISCFESGWARVPDPNACLCGLELARIHAERGEIDSIRRLLDRADAVLERAASDSVHGHFQNTIMALAGHPALEPFAEEIRDRALMSLARKLARSVERHDPTGPMVSSLFGGFLHWSPATVRDADFAASAARAVSSSTIKSPGRARLREIPRRQRTSHGGLPGIVGGRLFLGFENGNVIGFQPSSGRVFPIAVAENANPVTALAVDPEGDTVVALRRSQNGIVMSCSSRNPDGSFRSRPDDHIPSLSRSWLTPVLPRGLERLIGLGDGNDLIFVDAASGMHWGRLTIGDDPSDPPTTALLIPMGTAKISATDPLAVFTHNGPQWIVLDVHGDLLHQPAYRCRPAAPGDECPLNSFSMSWRHVPPFLELLILDHAGPCLRPSSRSRRVCSSWLPTHRHDRRGLHGDDAMWSQDRGRVAPRSNRLAQGSTGPVPIGG